MTSHAASVYARKRDLPKCPSYQSVDEQVGWLCLGTEGVGLDEEEIQGNLAIDLCDDKGNKTLST